MKMQYSTSQLLELRHALKVSIECPEIKEIDKATEWEKGRDLEYVRGIGTGGEATSATASKVAYYRIPTGSLMLRVDPGMKIPQDAIFIPYIPVGGYAPVVEPNPECIHETTHYDRDGNKLTTSEENTSVSIFQEKFAKPTKFKYMPGVASKDNPYAVSGFFPSDAGSTSDADTNSYSHSTYTSSDIQIQLPPV